MPGTKRVRKLYRQGLRGSNPGLDPSFAWGDGGSFPASLWHSESRCYRARHPPDIGNHVTDLTSIRNSRSSPIDNGKSTLADRLIQRTAADRSRDVGAVLDNMDIRRARHHHQSRTVRLDYTAKDDIGPMSSI